MKIRAVEWNQRRKAFEVAVGRRRYVFPFAQLQPPPSPNNPIAKAYVDDELGGEAFTYELASGEQGTVHVDHVLAYNRDPRYLRDMLIYRLTLIAQQRVRRTRLSKRELIRRLGTSAAQFYRLLDQTNCRKSLGQLVDLLGILDCEVELTVREGRRTGPLRAPIKRTPPAKGGTVALR
jgi:hypothetical protein